MNSNTDFNVIHNTNFNVIHFIMVIAVKAQSFYGTRWNKAYKVRFNEGKKGLDSLTLKWAKEYHKLNQSNPKKYVLHSHYIGQWVEQKVSE